MKQKRSFKIGVAGTLLTVGLLTAAFTTRTANESVRVVDRPDTQSTNANYVSYRAPLRPLNFIKLPVGSIQPEGWVKKYLELQREGLTGHLGEISAWLEKDNNAWLTTGGDHGWEEVPYWLKGYGNLAYILNDPKMIAETKTWIEGVFASCQPDGYFGPINERNGKRELWAQMIMLWCLQSYYEYSPLKDVKGYAWLTFDQINWYRQQSAAYTAQNGGQPLPALAFFHIPLPEYNEAASDENAILRGTRMEEACAPKLNTGMFAAMKESGDVMGMFVGHDHDNDYAVMWKGILLAYGRFTGGNTEYNHLPNGARIIVLDEGARTFTSWIRQKDGIVDKVSYPASFVKDDWTKR